MKLNSLKPAKGSVKSSKRIARGVGAGSGRTATRGHKGAKSRSGYSSKRAFEGGQMPLQMRLPKRGFKNTHKRYKGSRPSNFIACNIATLQAMNASNGTTEFTPAYFLAENLYTAPYKVLGDGQLTAALEVSAYRFSKSAKEQITAAGGNAYYVLSLSAIQGVASSLGKDTINVEDLSQYFTYLSAGDKIHVVAEGDVSTALKIEVSKISDAAKSQLEAAGGSVNLV